jgi:raffinose/stachyose/melibiose transport system substrate-binding protein
VYRKLGLKIPLTWAQFMQNNAKIKKAGIVPVISTYKDSWTAQLFVLADEFNVQTVSPNFPAMFTANRASISKTPAAMAGFQHLEQVNKSGYQNKDFATATLATGLKYLATGKGAHYPMLSFVVTDLEKSYPKLADNVGIFAQPGNSAKQNGLTVWMPNGLFISKTTTHLEASKKFVAFSATSAGIAAMTSAVAPTGPYLIKGAKLSGHISQITKEMLSYLNAEGRTAPALEFVSPIKGPNLSTIVVQVGSGVKTAAQGALAYDADVRKESKRLGLPGWGVLPRP